MRPWHACRATPRRGRGGARNEKRISHQLNAMTLLKELIDIPEHIDKGQFVLRLAEDINRPEVVLENYVVTDELRVCFDDALTFIRNSLQSRTSKAGYLHGSFGSG